MSQEAEADEGPPEPEDTREAIMGATFRALCKHGYANLTMQNIADEFEKSKSLLHYHFDSKEDLLLAFLDSTIGWVSERVEESGAESPEEKVLEFVDRLTIPPDHDGAFVLALFELRMQAVHNEAFRARLAAQYSRNVDTLAEILADGIEDGTFDDHDPYTVAEFICGAIEGSRMREVVLGEDGASRKVRDGIENQLLPALTTDTIDE